jgi:predicted secreted protein
MHRALGITVLCVLMAVTGVARSESSHESVTYNLVDLQADAQREVPNDLLQAVLFTEATNSDPGRLAADLNTELHGALDSAKAFDTVTTRTGGYRTYPVYDRNQDLTGWRGRAEIRLQSRDFQAASKLIGALQGRLQLASLDFSVSPEARKDAEDVLLTQAIKAFNARAEIVRAALAGRSFRIRHLSLGIQGGSPPPRPLQFARAAAKAAPAPALEAGTSLVTVVASGTIEVE